MEPQMVMAPCSRQTCSPNFLARHQTLLPPLQEEGHGAVFGARCAGQCSIVHHWTFNRVDYPDKNWLPGNTC
jgi:hypothetical protein